MRLRLLSLLLMDWLSFFCTCVLGLEGEKRSGPGYFIELGAFGILGGLMLVLSWAGSEK